MTKRDATALGAALGDLILPMSVTIILLSMVFQACTSPH